MTDWFARPVLHVGNVERSLRFYADQLGFTIAWRYEEEGKLRIAQVDRQGCAAILCDMWPEKIGKSLLFVSLNVEPPTHEAPRRRWMRCGRSWSRAGLRCGRAGGATGFWSWTIRTAISCSSITRRSPQRARIRPRQPRRSGPAASLQKTPLLRRCA